MKFRTIVAILVVVTGLVGSYYIINGLNFLPSLEVNINNSEIKDKNGTNEKLSYESPVQSPIKWLKDSIDGNSGTSTDGQVINSGDNLTKYIADSLFGQMKSADNKGINPFEILDPKNSDGQKMMASALGNFDNPELVFIPIINEKNLSISSDNSKEAKIKYLNEIGGLIQKSSIENPEGPRSPSQIIDDIKVDCNKFNQNSQNNKISALAKDFAGDLMKLTVPSGWLNFHKQIIYNFERTSLIYAGLANCSNDLIRGYLAAQELLKLSDESKKINNSLIEKYKEVGMM